MVHKSLSPASLQVQAAIDADRRRRLAILDCEEASSRPNLARHLAFKTNLDLDEAKKCLVLAGIENRKSEERETPFSSYMDVAAQPGVGAGPSLDTKQRSEADDLDGSATAKLAKNLGLKGFAKQPRDKS